MAIEIYKVVRAGGNGLRFETAEGPAFVDPNGLKNPQLVKIVGNKLMAYVRCEVGNGVSQVVGEASADEVAGFEVRGDSESARDEGGEGPFKFNAR